MNIHDFAFIKGLKFRNYIFKVICVVFAILNSYKVISDDKLNLFYFLAFTVSGLSSITIDNTVNSIEHIKHQEERRDNDRNIDR